MRKRNINSARNRYTRFIPNALIYEEMMPLIKVMHAAGDDADDDNDDDDDGDGDGFHFVFGLHQYWYL